MIYHNTLIAASALNSEQRFPHVLLFRFHCEFVLRPWVVVEARRIWDFSTIARLRLALSIKSYDYTRSTLSFDLHKESATTDHRGGCGYRLTIVRCGCWVWSRPQSKRALCCTSVAAVRSVPTRLGLSTTAIVDQGRASVESRDITLDRIPCADPADWSSSIALLSAYGQRQRRQYDIRCGN